MSKRKFKRGAKITSLDELLNHEYFMVEYGVGRDKTVHCGFVRSWQVNTANNFIMRGMVHVAERLTNLEFYDKQTNEQIGDMLEERLCDFCTLPEEARGVHCYGGEPVMCEGTHCDEAIEAWKEEYVE